MIHLRRACLLGSALAAMMFTALAPANAVGQPTVALEDLDKPSVVVASGTEGHTVDSLSAGPLAATLGTSVLLVPSEAMSGHTYYYLTNQHIQVVYLIGGTTAVSSTVEERIKSYGIKVIRIAGADRYETSANVALVNDSIFELAQAGDL